MASKVTTKKWADIKAKAKPAVRAAGEADARAALARDRQHLADIRKARELTQAEIADKMQGHQGDVSKIERSADMMISTMSRYVEAAGGTLRLVAAWDDGSETEVSLVEEAGAR